MQAITAKSTSYVRDPKTRETDQTTALQAKSTGQRQSPIAFVDNRPEAVTQRKVAAMINSSPRVMQQKALSDAIHNSPRMLAQRQKMDALFGSALQRQEGEALSLLLTPAPTMEHAPLPEKFYAGASVQLAQQAASKSNNTGLPDQLKSGIEALSGIAMDHVNVHYNSSQPAQLNAYAYAQGSDIHIAPGQEMNLPHEAWHVVQQAQGRVRPTMQMKAGVPLNDDAGLESEADAMGAKALAAGGGIVRQMAGDASPLRASPHRADSAIQLVARTQTVHLVTTGTPPCMGVNGGGAGQAPIDASVGVTMALGTDGWGGVANAPTAEYWRAHALAEVLGGQGDNTNVGWWTKADEIAWSKFEEKAQGRKGLGFDKDFQPGMAEQGSYTVNSNSVQVDVKPNFAVGIGAAVDELNNATLNYVGTAAASGVAAQAGVNWGAAQTDARNKLHHVAAGRINTWLDVVFAPTAGGPFAWTSLAGTYERTGAPGKGKGQKREKKMEQAQTPTPLLAANFRITAGSEAALWGLMRDANMGVYARGNNPFAQLATVIAVNDATSEVGRFRFTIGAGAPPQIDVDF